MIQEMEKIPGGTIFHSISALDPAGRFWVRCERHLDYTIEVNHNYFSINGFDVENAILRQAQDLLAECPACIEEKKLTVTRMCAQEEHDACSCAEKK